MSEHRLIFSSPPAFHERLTYFLRSKLTADDQPDLPRRTQHLPVFRKDVLVIDPPIISIGNSTFNVTTGGQASPTSSSDNTVLYYVRSAPLSRDIVVLIWLCTLIIAEIQTVISRKKREAGEGVSAPGWKLNFETTTLSVQRERQSSL